MSDIQETLKERGNNYGPFDGHADITQAIKMVMVGTVDIGAERHKVRTNWQSLNFSQREALEMIAHKLGRILNGNPNYDDSWRDIAGYAMLIVNQLNGDK